MILPCAAGSLSNVGTMHVRRRILDGGLLFGYEVFNIAGCFIVEFMKLWTIASYSEEGVHLFICFEKLGAMP